MSQINTDEVFKKIKKQNGEAVAKVLREAVLLDVPNIVHILEFAGSNPDEIRGLVPVIRERFVIQPKYIEIATDKTPFDLLNYAGYDAFYVETEKQKNSIKKYYRRGEEICTFKDPVRHKNFFIIHAVKRGAEKIQPAKNPDRDDEYGTSVISIQIAKNGGFISIKNRYNHTVQNSDATFNNNPDNIIPGLSESLKKYFNVDFVSLKSSMPSCFCLIDDQFVHYNFETNDFYFDNNYYFTGNKIVKLNNDYEYMMDSFVFNVKTSQLINPSNTEDSAFQILQHLLEGKKIKIQSNSENKKMFFANGEHVLTIFNGQIIELNIPDVQRIDNVFLKTNSALRFFYAPKLESVGDGFLSKNTSLININFPNLCSVGDGFLSSAVGLQQIDLPNLREAGAGFLGICKSLTRLSLPKLKTLGANSLTLLNTPDLYLPKLEKVSDGCLQLNESKKLSFPALKTVGNYFLSHNHEIAELNVPNLEKVGDEFLLSATALKKIFLPKLKVAGDDFLYNDTVLSKIYAPNLEKVGKSFLQRNISLNKLFLPKLKKCGADFLHACQSLKSLTLPEFQCADGGFLTNSGDLIEFFAPKLDSKTLRFRLTFIVTKNRLKQILLKNRYAKNTFKKDLTQNYRT